MLSILILLWNFSYNWLTRSSPGCFGASLAGGGGGGGGGWGSVVIFIIIAYIPLKLDRHTGSPMI